MKKLCTTLLLLFLNVTLTNAQVLPPKDIERHPQLAPVNSIHLDHFNTATTDMDAPANGRLKVKTHYFGKVPLLGRLGINTCLNYMVDEEDNLYGFCSRPLAGFMKGIAFELVLFNQDTMKKKSSYTFFKVSLLDVIKNKLPMNLGYFVMDKSGRVIVTTAEGKILFLKKDSKDKIQQVKEIDISEQIKGKGLLSQVIPDYEGNYWFFMPGERGEFHAQVGYINKDNEKIYLAELTNELIENGMAVDSTGVYVVSDYALYKMRFEETHIKLVMREEYARSSTRKPGTISLEGSGTTPTLMNNDMIAITDNADGQVNLLVYDRADFNIRDNRLICKVPIFEKDKSSVENTVVAYRNSIIVQNWHNSPKYLGSLKDMEPGIVRIDVRPDKSGCDLVWWNKTSFGTSTIKMSTQTGLLYLATQNRSRLPKEKSYIEFIDFKTGEVIRKVYIGKGLTHRFMMSPIYIAPRGRLIQPIYSGIVEISEQR